MAAAGHFQEPATGIVDDPRLASRRLLIAYGSETGNSQDAAETLGRVAERLRFQAHLCEMNDITFRSLHDFELVVFVVSTTGQGEIPKNAKTFWKSLLRKQLPPDCLASLHFTTFGLGDSSYSKFNWAARKLHKRLEQLGGTEFYPRGEADERHDDGIDGAFIPWYTSLRTHLTFSHPLPDDLPPLPLNVRLPPKFTIDLAPTMAEKNRKDASSVELPDPGGLLDRLAARFSHIDVKDPQQLEHELLFERLQPKGNVVLARLSELTASKVSGGIDVLDRPNVLRDDPAKYQLATTANDEEALPPANLLPIPNSHEALILSNERVTPKDHWQDVRSLSLYVENVHPRTGELLTIPITPGAVVTIYPKNFPADVQLLIDIMDWGDVADKVFVHHSRLNLGFTQAPEPKGCYPLSRSTLRELLINNYDITAIPKRVFFELIAWYTDDDTHRERLREFADPKYTDEFYDYTSRPRRSILEILHDFPSVKIPFRDVPSIFPVIRGREYSIASGGELCVPRPGVLRLDIIVALVKYKTVLRKVRQGLCSRYLAAIEPRTVINVRVGSSNKGPPTGAENAQRPLLAIAPGTGVAPMRSLIWDRRGIDLVDAAGSNVLFFGGRNRKSDFFYEREWQWLGVEVHTAFSRDQREKVYVQDLIRQQGPLICDLISRNAIICLCGSAGRMPEAVRQALCDVMVEGKIAADQDAAKKLFDNPNRYWEEVW
ncbi:sulfite reductase (NADPH) flavoprotein alpha-component [Microdochium nivale]|nr:sulfite reductase (NADPH) flavoprotein alpha-component [Microdochium nivale]